MLQEYLVWRWQPEGWNGLAVWQSPEGWLAEAVAAFPFGRAGSQ
jgi:hypothetical protein